MLGRPGQDVTNRLGVSARGGDGREAALHDAPRVRLEERRGVHAAEEHSAVEAVSPVHHPPHAIRVLVRLAGKAGRHETDEVGLDLEVDVVGVEVVPGVARPRSLDSAVQGAACAGIRVPELVPGGLEHLAVLLRGRIEADGVHDLGEGHLDVEVVLVHGVLETLRGPIAELAQVALDDSAIRLELGGGAVRDADHLACPASADLVLEIRPRDAAGLGPRARGYQHCQHHDGGRGSLSLHHSILPPASRASSQASSCSRVGIPG